MTHAGGEPGVELGTIVTDPTIRKIIYAVYTVLLLALGAVTVGFSALGLPLPAWGIAAGAVLSYIGIPIGGLAIANTPVKGS